MWGNLNGMHLVILLVVILLLFGAAKLPALAKSMGQSARLFRGEMKAMKMEDTDSSVHVEDALVADGATGQRSDAVIDVPVSSATGAERDII